MNFNRCILLIDSQPDDLTYLSALFEDHGYDVVRAMNKTEALLKAKQEIPDLVILSFTPMEDWGMKIYRILKNDFQLRVLPVILLTSEGETWDDMARKFAAFPVPEAIFSKPIKAEPLLNAINRIVTA